MKSKPVVTLRFGTGKPTVRLGTDKPKETFFARSYISTFRHNLATKKVK